MKRVFILLIAISISTNLTGCTNEIVNNNEPDTGLSTGYSIAGNYTEIEDFDFQTFDISDEVKQLLEEYKIKNLFIEDGYLIVVYEESYRNVYISKITEDGIEWTKGDYGYVWSITRLEPGKYQVEYSYEIYYGNIVIMDQDGNESFILGDVDGYPIELEDSYVALEWVHRTTSTVEERYQVTRAYENYTDVIFTFECIYQLEFKQLEDGNFFISYRTASDEIVVVRISPEGNVLHQYAFGDRAFRIKPLKNGYLINDQMSERLYQTDLELNELWSRSFNGSVLRIYAETNEYIVVNLYSNIYRIEKIDSNGSNSIVKVEDYLTSFSIHYHIATLDNGDEIGIMNYFNGEYLLRLDVDGNLIWKREVTANHIYNFMHNDIIYISVNNSISKYTLDGTHISTDTTSCNIRLISSDDNFICVNYNKEVLKLDNEYNIIWSSDSFNNVGSIIEGTNNSLIVSYPEYWSSIDPGFYLTGYFNVVIDQNGKLMKDFSDDFYFGHSFKYQGRQFLVISALHESTTLLPGKHIVEIDETGNIIETYTFVAQFYNNEKNTYSFFLINDGALEVYTISTK